GAPLSALRLIFKSSAFEPTFSPWGRQARMPESERPKCGTDAAPQSVHKGLGGMGIKIALHFILNVDYFDNLHNKLYTPQAPK
ncbi:MAG: hypothetical protein ACI4JI_06720, partial [Ruminiclostridium sp.]